jgi:hypothetical protein
MKRLGRLFLKRQFPQWELALFVLVIRQKASWTGKF